MMEVDQAQRQILDATRRLAVQSRPALEALGLVLAEEIRSDIDSPPHDKSLMDGYAIRAEDVQQGRTTLRVIEDVMAGMVPQRTVEPGTAVRIMTGAPIPLGADTVVMVEQTRLVSDGDPSLVHIGAEVSPGQNLMRRGQSMRRGDVVLKQGRLVTAVHVGLLAEVGRTDVSVYPPPQVSVLSTGDELVAAGSPPAAGQIRNSNGPMLAAQVLRAGGQAVDLGIGRDEYDHLAERIGRGLQSPILLISGGVSAGDRDLTPRVLQDLGVRQVFHRVNLKPGKPLWFGIMRQGDSTGLVFGLPGNPVSTLVCFELFVRPAIGQLMGRRNELPRRTARLATAHQQRGDRPTYFPSIVTESGSTASVQLLDWQGSADLRTLADANCLTFFPAGRQQFDHGDSVEILLLDQGWR